MQTITLTNKDRAILKNAATKSTLLRGFTLSYLIGFELSNMNVGRQVHHSLSKEVQAAIKLIYSDFIEAMPEVTKKLLGAATTHKQRLYLDYELTSRLYDYLPESRFAELERKYYYLKFSIKEERRLREFIKFIEFQASPMKYRVAYAQA